MKKYKGGIKMPVLDRKEVQYGKTIPIRKMKLYEIASFVRGISENKPVIDTPTVEEMKTYLGINNTKPIVACPDDDKDMIEKGDCFAEWYREELEAIYKSCR